MLLRTVMPRSFGVPRCVCVRPPMAHAQNGASGRTGQENARRGQSRLMRCLDGSYYVVKFQNNPQGLRILANELLGTRLPARLGLRVPKPEIIDVREELIANNRGFGDSTGARARILPA